MSSAVQFRETVVVNEKSEKKPFIYSKDDESYLAPAICRLMHYRNAAVFCGILDILLLVLAILIFVNLQLENANIHMLLLVTLIIFLIFATATTLLMIYGIVTEEPKYMWPLMAFMHIEITILIIATVVSITSMSMGLQATHRLFGFYASIYKLESNFGPIWPFNLAVISFFGATIIIWSYIIVRGAYDYLLDKDYFTKKPNMELVKTIVVNRT